MYGKYIFKRSLVWKYTQTEMRVKFVKPDSSLTKHPDLKTDRQKSLPSTFYWIFSPVSFDQLLQSWLLTTFNLGLLAFKKKIVQYKAI